MPSTVDLRIVRLFALLLIPVSSWQVWIFPSIPNYYAQHALLYPAALFLLWALWRGLWTVREAWQLCRRALPWVGIVLLMQALAGFDSARIYATGQGLWPVVKELLKWLTQLPFVLFFLLLCRVLLHDAQARRCLLFGALASFTLLTCLCLVQGLSVYSKDYPALAATRVDEICRAILLTVSPWLEARWVESVYNFYIEGAYALTLERFNGFFEEASALCSMLAVFFIPLAFGLLALGERWGKKFWILGGCIALSAGLLMLMLCRSTTGQLLTAVALALLLGLSLRGRYRLFKAGVGCALVAACLYAALFLPQVPSYLVNRMEYFEMGTSPRIVTFLDTMDMIRANPVLGVGRGWYFQHLHQGQRYLKNLQDPELRIWKERGSGGELWALPALVAQYGLPLILAALFFVARTCWLLRRRAQCETHNSTLVFASGMAVAWLGLGLVATMASFDIRNPLFCLPFFCFYILAHGLELPQEHRVPPCAA